MPDYDVGATGLAQPPPSAVVTTYRPAVAVRNNGIHDALASGVLRIYRGGLLVFTSEIYSPTIPPGETRNAEAVLYWTPGELGDYYVSADVTCPLDQVEPNNHLAPVKVTVGPGEPPEPPVITLHAAQHEEGGTDQLSIDGLRGECFDPQPPKDHVSRHEQGGSDEMSVSGLHGTLADAQPTEAHGNEKHSVPFATADQLAAHLDDGTDVHTGAFNLEQTTNKGKALGYCDLDAGIKVPAARLGTGTAAAEASLRGDRSWKPASVVAVQQARGASIPSGSSGTVLTYTLPAAPGATSIDIDIFGTMTDWSGVGNDVNFKVNIGGWAIGLLLHYPTAGVDAKVHYHGHIDIDPAGAATCHACLAARCASDGLVGATDEVAIDPSTTFDSSNPVDVVVKVYTGDFVWNREAETIRVMKA